MEDGGAHLLDSSDGVVLSTLPLEDKCVFYGSRIKDGAPRVCLTVRALNTDYKLKLNNHTAAISIKAVSPLIEALNAAEFSDPGGALGEHELIVYCTPCQTGCCCVCKESTADKSLGFGAGNSPVRCHVECVPSLIDGLENVWNYTDEILGDAI